MIVDVKITRHGPIVSEFLPAKLVSRSALDSVRRLAHPFFDLNSAQNWEEFRHAFSEFDAPGQNVVYADVDGNIGYQTTGRFPFAPPATAACPRAAPTMLTSGPATFRSTSCPASSIRRPALSPPPTDASRPMDIPIPSARSGKRHGAPSVFITCWNREGKFAAADMLALQTDIFSENVFLRRTLRLCRGPCQKSFNPRQAGRGNHAPLGRPYVR